MQLNHAALARRDGESARHYNAFVTWVATQNLAQTARETGIAYSTCRWLLKRWTWADRNSVYLACMAERDNALEQQREGLSKEAKELCETTRRQAESMARISDMAIQLAERELTRALEGGERIQVSALNSLIKTCSQSLQEARELSGVGELVDQVADMVAESAPAKAKGRASSWQSK